MNQPKKWLEPPLDSKSKLLILNHDYASKHNLEIVNLGNQEYYKEDLLNNFSRIKRVLRKATIRLEKSFQELRSYCAESYSQYDYILFQSHDQPVYNIGNKSFKEVLEDSYVVISFDIKRLLRPSTTISSFLFNLPNRSVGWNWIQQQQHTLQKHKKSFLVVDFPTTESREAHRFFQLTNLVKAWYRSCQYLEAYFKSSIDIQAYEALKDSKTGIKLIVDDDTVYVYVKHAPSALLQDRGLPQCIWHGSIKDLQKENLLLDLNLQRG